MSIRYLIEAMGAKYAHKCQWIFLKLRVRDEFRMVVVLCILSGLSLLVFAVTRNTWFIPLYAIFYFCLSTVHSVISLTNNLFGIVFLLIAGIVFDMLSISIGLVLLSVYVMMMSIILFVYYTIYSNVARQRDIRRRN